MKFLGFDVMYWLLLIAAVLGGLYYIGMNGKEPV